MRIAVGSPFSDLAEKIGVSIKTIVDTALGRTQPKFRGTCQYEMTTDGHSIPIVRYDTAHGQPHQDILDRQGNVKHKRWLVGKTPSEALVEAVTDLVGNWQEYRRAFSPRSNHDDA